MANHFSALKRARQTTTRTARNRANTSQFRTVLRKFREALQSGKSADAKAAFSGTVSMIDKAAKKVESLEIAQAPEADKKDPATLSVVTPLDAKEPIEELVSHSMRLLDTLVVELAAHKE